MKFTFALERSQKSPKYPVKVITGREIKSPYVKPEYAEILREVAEHNKKAGRMYDAAITTNLNADFPLTVGSANAETLTSKYIARGRARTLVKDFPTAKAVQRAYCNNVVGDEPFRLEMKVGKRSADGKKFELERDTNEKIQEAWKEAGETENCTVRKDMSRLEMYHMVIASVVRDGDILARHIRGYDNKFGYALQFIESDRLQESYMGKAPNSNNIIRFSIERDKYDCPVAYWILNRNPGDLFQYNGMEPNNWRYRVDADEIIHFNNIRHRAEQDIGMPEFDSITQCLHRMRQFSIAHVSAAIWSAAKPYWIKQEYPTGMPYVGDPQILANAVGNVGQADGAEVGYQGRGDARGNGVDKWKRSNPAEGEMLQLGQSPVQLDPKFPIEGASQFNRDNYLEIAQGTGLGEGTVSGNYEKYSFSTARAALIPERDNFKVYQKHMVMSFVKKHFKEWLKYALLTRAIDLPLSRLDEFCKAAHFHAKRWPYIQPVQDVQADIEGIEARLESPQGVQANNESGKSVEDVLMEIAAFEQMAEDYGVVLGEVTKPVIAKGTGEPGELDPDPNDLPAKNGKSRLQYGH